MTTPKDAPADPFATLRVPRSFALEPAMLQRAYLRASAKSHPDMAGGIAESGSSADSGNSAAINAARDLLADPERRAGVLLALLGGPGAGEDASLPDGFLMEILEVREEVESARGDPAATAEWESWADARRAEYIERVASMFESAEGDGSVLCAIRQELNAWRYIERLIEQLDPDYDPARADFS